MSAKIQLKSDLVGTFGGIFLMLDHFNKAGLDKLVDKLLGNRRFNAKYLISIIIGINEKLSILLCNRENM